MPSIDAYEHVLDESRNKAKELEAKYADKMKSHNVSIQILRLYKAISWRFFVFALFHTLN